VGTPTALRLRTFSLPPLIGQGERDFFAMADGAIPKKAPDQKYPEMFRIIDSDSR